MYLSVAIGTQGDTVGGHIRAFAFDAVGVRGEAIISANSTSVAEPLPKTEIARNRRWLCASVVAITKRGDVVRDDAHRWLGAMGNDTGMMMLSELCPSLLLPCVLSLAENSMGLIVIATAGRNAIYYPARCGPLAARLATD